MIRFLSTVISIFLRIGVDYSLYFLDSRREISIDFYRVFEVRVSLDSGIFHNNFLSIFVYGKIHFTLFFRVR